MRSNQRIAYVKLRGLSCTFKVEQGAAVLEWVGNGNAGAIPAVTAVVRCIGIAGVVMIEAVRELNFLPYCDFVAAPNLPWAIQRALVVLPAGIQD